MRSLNNKGFGLVTLVVFIIVFLIAIIIIAILTNSMNLSAGNNTNLNKEYEGDVVYRNYEQSVSQAAVTYYDNNSVDVLDGESAIIPIEKLSISDTILNSCSGYVKIANNSNEVEYSPYLNCGEYKTSNYIPSLDE